MPKETDQLECALSSEGSYTAASVRSGKYIEKVLVTKLLSVQTPEVPNWVFDLLGRSGVPLYPVEGYSVKEDAVTALFERRASSVKVEDWLESEVVQWLAGKEKEAPWAARIKLADSLDVPLHLVLWQEMKEDFRVFSVILDGGNTIGVVNQELFHSCEAFAEWMGNLKGIRVTKRFEESGRLSSIDRCLRQCGVPWPGNLDGFTVSKTSGDVKAVFEFSRTRKTPVRQHDLNHYFSQDINRWRVLDILRKQLDVPLYIVLWSSSESVVKLLEVKDVTRSALAYGSIEMLSRSTLVKRFEQFVR